VYRLGVEGKSSKEVDAGIFRVAIAQNGSQGTLIPFYSLRDHPQGPPAPRRLGSVGWDNRRQPTMIEGQLPQPTPNQQPTDPTDGQPIVCTWFSTFKGVQSISDLGYPKFLSFGPSLIGKTC